MNKKADVFQLLVLLIILFVSAIVGIIFLGLSTNISNFWVESGMLNDTETGLYANQIIQASGPLATDYMIFFLFLGGTIGLIVSAVRTNFSPTIIFLFIMLLIISIFVASGLVNIYSGFANTPALQEAGDQMVLTGFVFSKYTPLMIGIIGIIVMLIMWGKSGGDIIT